MPTLARRWTLKRLRGRLRKAERAKNRAMQALEVRDRCVAPRARYDYQDPGQIATMLDEIAVLRTRIATIEAPEAPAPEPVAAPEPPPPPVPGPFARGALDPLFGALRDELRRIQHETADGRIGSDALRRALAAAFASERVLDAAFESLKVEMVRIQHSTHPGRIGLASLRDAVRASLVGSADSDADACPAGAIPDRPAA